MAVRMSIVITKGCSEQELRSAIEERAGADGAHVMWDSDEQIGEFLGVRSIQDVHTCWCDSEAVLNVVCDAINAMHRPLLIASIREGDHWDYTLRQGNQVLDEFTTNPWYYHEDEADHIHYRGKPDLLASIWGVTEERIEKYVVSWGKAGVDLVEGPFPGMKTAHVDPRTGNARILDGVVKQSFALKGKAYPNDQHEYRDIWQIYDFIRAIGGDEPPGWRLGDMLGDEPAPGSRSNVVFPESVSDKHGCCVLEGRLSAFLRKITSWFRS